MVHPCWVGGEELTRPGGHPFGEPVVILPRRTDLPAHDEEHDVQYRHLLGEFGQVREFGEDVGEDFAERMGVEAALGIQEGGDGRVGGTDEVGRRGAFGGAGTAFGEEVQEDDVDGAGGRNIADGDVVRDQRRVEARGGFGGLDGRRKIGRREASIYMGVGGDAMGDVWTGDGGSCVVTIEEEAQVQSFARGVDVQVVREIVSLLFQIGGARRKHGAMRGVRGR